MAAGALLLSSKVIECVLRAEKIACAMIKIETN